MEQTEQIFFPLPRLALQNLDHRLERKWEGKPVTTGWALLHALEQKVCIWATSSSPGSCGRLRKQGADEKKRFTTGRRSGSSESGSGFSWCGFSNWMILVMVDCAHSPLTKNFSEELLMIEKKCNKRVKLNHGREIHPP